MLLSLLIVPSASHAAGTSSLSLSPNSGTVKKGDTVVITVKESSTVAVNAIEADVTYDPAYWQYVSYDKSTGAFSNSNNTFFIASTGSTQSGLGVVKLGGALLGATFTGDQTVATITFTAVGGSGSSSLSFDTTSDIQNAGVSSWDQVTTGGTFSFTSTTSTTTTTSPTPPPPVTSTTTTKTTTKSTKTTAATTTPTPKPVVTPVTASTSPSANPPSYFVSIKVSDSKGKPINGASVTIDGQTVKTDSTGAASFLHITAGSHVADVNYGRKHASLPITVVSTAGANLQQFSVVLGLSGLQQALWAGAVILLIILITGGGIMLGLSLIRKPHAMVVPKVSPIVATAGGAAATSAPISTPTVSPPPANPAAPADFPQTPAPPAATTNNADINPVGQVFYPDPTVQAPKPPTNTEES